MEGIGRPTQRQKRSRKVTTARVKWTEDMERAIFDYAKDARALGREFEKPTAPDYYRKLIESVNGFGGVTVDKMVQHMKNWKSKYSMALEWRGKTGQGILEVDPDSGNATVEGELIKRCKYFKELDEILGERPQFNPPYLHHSGSPSAEDSFDLNSIINENNLIVNQNEEDKLNSIDGIENEENVSPSPTDNQTLSSSPPMKKRLKKDPIKSAASALESAMTSRIVMDEKRLEWEKTLEDRKLKEILEKTKLEQEIKEKTLEFEKQKWQDEIDLRREHEERVFQLEKLRMENEAKLTLLRMEQEHELEKMKLSSK